MCECPHCKLKAAFIAALADTKTEEEKAYLVSTLCTSLQSLYPGMSLLIGIDQTLTIMEPRSEVDYPCLQ